MKIRNNPKLLKELANSVDDPWEFIEVIASLEKTPMREVFAKVDISKEHYYVSKNKKVMGIKLAIKFSNAFEINPTILNRVLADFNLKRVLETNEN